MQKRVVHAGIKHCKACLQSSAVRSKASSYHMVSLQSAYTCPFYISSLQQGTIIFACHKVSPTHPRTSTAMNQVDYPPYQSYYDQGSPYNTMQSVPPHEAAYGNGFSNASYSPQRWPSGDIYCFLLFFLRTGRD